MSVTVKVHCYEETSFSEVEVGDEKYLEVFMNMKNQTGDKYVNLRNSADAAALLVREEFIKIKLSCFKQF